jgi:hypothetical protein
MGAATQLILNGQAELNSPVIGATFAARKPVQPYRY